MSDSILLAIVGGRLVLSDNLPEKVRVFLRNLEPEILGATLISHDDPIATPGPLLVRTDHVQPTPDQRKAVIYTTQQAVALALLMGSDKLSRWFQQRMEAYYDSVAWDDAAYAFAAGRDYLCWRLGCTEAELFEKMGRHLDSEGE